MRPELVGRPDEGAATLGFEIDALVCELYGLTDEEISLIGGSGDA